MSIITIDGTEQLADETGYFYAAGARSLATGLIIATAGPAVAITGRVRIDSITGTLINSFTATLDPNTPLHQALQYAISGGSAAAPGANIVGHRVVLTIQGATATGTTVNGTLNVQAEGS